MKQAVVWLSMVRFLAIRFGAVQLIRVMCKFQMTSHVNAKFKSKKTLSCIRVNIVDNKYAENMGKLI